MFRIASRFYGTFFAPQTPEGCPLGAWGGPTVLLLTPRREGRAGGGWRGAGAGWSSFINFFFSGKIKIYCWGQGLEGDVSRVSLISEVPNTYGVHQR